MENINFNYRPCIITRFGFWLDTFVSVYRQYGIKMLFKYIALRIKQSVVRCLYKHSKKYRTHIANKQFNGSLIKQFIFESIINHSTISFQEYYNTLSKEDKAKFKEEYLEKKDDMVNFVIKDCKIINEKDLTFLYNYFDVKFDD